MAALLLALVSVASAQSSPGDVLAGRVVGIADGDTLTLLVGRSQHRIRLAEIDTPETGQPWSSRARQALADKVFRRTVRVNVVDVDRYGRSIGHIWRGDRHINRELVSEGHAWVYRRYLQDRSLLDDENAAQRARLGLWGLAADPVPPWSWRRGERGATRTASSMAALECGAKRYCRHMASCAEARHHLQHCGLAGLDGDGDGLPCETLCR